MPATPVGKMVAPEAGWLPATLTTPMVVVLLQEICEIGVGENWPELASVAPTGRFGSIVIVVLPNEMLTLAVLPLVKLQLACAPSGSKSMVAASSSRIRRITLFPPACRRAFPGSGGGWRPAAAGRADWRSRRYW